MVKRNQEDQSKIQFYVDMWSYSIPYLTILQITYYKES